MELQRHQSGMHFPLEQWNWSTSQLGASGLPTRYYYLLSPLHTYRLLHDCSALIQHLTTSLSYEQLCNYKTKRQFKSQCTEKYGNQLQYNTGLHLKPHQWRKTSWSLSLSDYRQNESGSRHGPEKRCRGVAEMNHKPVTHPDSCSCWWTSSLRNTGGNPAGQSPGNYRSTAGEAI